MRWYSRQNAIRYCPHALLNWSFIRLYYGQPFATYIRTVRVHNIGRVSKHRVTIGLTLGSIDVHVCLHTYALPYVFFAKFIRLSICIFCLLSPSVNVHVILVV